MAVAGIKRTWAAYSSAALKDWSRDRVVAILPVAAIEQHGPHLPLGVDGFIMDGLLDELQAQAGDAAFFTVLPTQYIGKSDEHEYAAGTITLSATTAINAWTEIGLAVSRVGIRRLIIISSHGGNRDVAAIVARALRIRENMLTGTTHWSYFGFPDRLYTQSEIDDGIHGGDIETSLMLHFRPDLVDMTAARHFENALSTRTRQSPAQALSPISIAWQADDLNPAGVVGDAAAATAEKGRLIARHQAEGFLAALHAFKDMDAPAG